MLVNVHVESLAVALMLPVRNAVAHAVQKRSAPQINVADEHAPEMADVAHLVVSQSKRTEEGKRRHNGNDCAHAHRHGDRE